MPRLKRNLISMFWRCWLLVFILNLDEIAGKQDPLPQTHHKRRRRKSDHHKRRHRKKNNHESSLTVESTVAPHVFDIVGHKGQFPWRSERSSLWAPGDLISSTRVKAATLLSTARSSPFWLMEKLSVPFQLKGSNESPSSDTETLASTAWKYLLDDTLWGEPVTSSEGVTVWKHWPPKDTYGSENSFVKSRSLVSASPGDIFDMIYDSSRTKEYNKYSVGRTDAVELGKTTKIVWNRTAPPGTKRPHDFCTLMHGETFTNGTQLLMTCATEHPKVKPSKEYLRSEILLGVNLMVPISEGQTELTCINHVKTKGVPTFLAERVSAGSAIDFVRQVRQICGGISASS